MHGINGAQAEEIANALNADEIYDNVGYLQIRFYDLDVEKINKNIT